jgi:glyoxylase-like metal-dependent hydrolase (beta-lactamase superfamily II)
MVQGQVSKDDKNVLTLGESPWEAIHTPGHARGHICLYHRQSGRLLSGDHLLRDISSNPILEPPLPGEAERPHSLAQHLRSLEWVTALEVAVALPGHGAPITHVHDLIAWRVRFHRRRPEQIAHVLVERPKTAFEIAAALFPGLRGIQVFLAVSEIIGHLDILEQEVRVVSQQEDGIVFYVLTDKG